MTIYDLKPKFQEFLRPTLNAFYNRGITPNHITLLALTLSIAMGATIWMTHGATWTLLFLPLFLFIRMALNAIDGLLAKEYNLQSDSGAILNEMGDILSDMALYLPFAIIAGFDTVIIVAIVILAILSESVGILVWAIKGERAYQGPMGKSDRAFAFGLMGVLYVALGLGVWIDIVLVVVIILSLKTIYNRWRVVL